MTKTKNTFLALIAVLLIPAAANADVIEYDITVADDWFDCCGEPYGMSLSPILTGSITVDNDLVGIDALVGFSLTTGSMNWMLGDFTGNFSADIIFDALGNLSSFGLDRFEDGLGGEMYIYSNNTMGVGDAAGGFNACNGCVSFVAAPVPEPGALALLGLGLFGIGLARRRKTA